MDGFSVTFRVEVGGVLSRGRLKCGAVFSAMSHRTGISLLLTTHIEGDQKCGYENSEVVC